MLAASGEVEREPIDEDGVVCPEATASYAGSGGSIRELVYVATDSDVDGAVESTLLVGSGANRTCPPGSIGSLTSAAGVETSSVVISGTT